MKPRTKHAVTVGLTAAGSAFAIELVLSRMGFGSVGRSLARLAVGGGIAYAARNRYPVAAEGVFTGAVMLTAFDAGTSLISSRPAQPPALPAGATMLQLAQPWSPRIV